MNSHIDDIALTIIVLHFTLSNHQIEIRHNNNIETTDFKDNTLVLIATEKFASLQPEVTSLIGPLLQIGTKLGNFCTGAASPTLPP